MRMNPPTSQSAVSIGLRIQAEFRWSSSRCRPAVTSVRTTSSVSTMSMVEIESDHCLFVAEDGRYGRIEITLISTALLGPMLSRIRYLRRYPIVRIRAKEIFRLRNHTTGASFYGQRWLPFSHELKWRLAR